MQHVKARLRGGHDARELAGAIRRRVIHDQYFETRVLSQHRRDQPWEVLSLIVGGDDYE